MWDVPNLNPFGGSRDGENSITGHSTQKPVRLFEIPILNHTRRSDAVFDPFLGSGTTLIAAEKTAVRVSPWNSSRVTCRPRSSGGSGPPARRP